MNDIEDDFYEVLRESEDPAQSILDDLDSSLDAIGRILDDLEVLSYM